MIDFSTFLICTAILIGLCALYFWCAMAVHCFKSRELTREQRWLWLAVIALGKLLGAGAYYLVRYRRRTPARVPAR